ncbi:MAG: formyltetrahydrofolate deformylase [Gammaproteobacteria bacterium]
MADGRYILTLSCRDAAGIVAAVAGFIAARDGFILESTQFGDPSTEQFFLRMDFRAGPGTPDRASLEALFGAEVADRFAMRWRLHDAERRPRLMIMVSREGHCLNDLLHRARVGTLAVDIAGVVSNHEDFRDLVEWRGIPYHHLPVTGSTRRAQEERIRELVGELRVDVVALARYMQILGPELTRDLSGRAINIHHSFLPSFKGAKPYHQAYERGVKLIGATAHYVTDTLDEGPIIEQEVIRVDHAHSPRELMALGQDIECVVLARALKYHCEQRVLLNGNKTVVFR